MYLTSNPKVRAGVQGKRFTLSLILLLRSVPTAVAKRSFHTSFAVQDLLSFPLYGWHVFVL